MLLLMGRVKGQFIEEYADRKSDTVREQTREVIKAAAKQWCIDENEFNIIKAAHCDAKKQKTVDFLNFYDYVSDLMSELRKGKFF